MSSSGRCAAGGIGTHTHPHPQQSRAAQPIDALLLIPSAQVRNPGITCLPSLLSPQSGDHVPSFPPESAIRGSRAFLPSSKQFGERHLPQLVRTPQVCPCGGGREGRRRPQGDRRIASFDRDPASGQHQDGSETSAGSESSGIRTHAVAAKVRPHELAPPSGFRPFAPRRLMWHTFASGFG